MKEPNSSTSAKRALQILRALKGKSLTGLSNGELAEALGISPVNVTRSLQALMSEGFVQKTETGRFAYSVQMLQMAQSHANEMMTAQVRLNELSQRINAGSGQ